VTRWGEEVEHKESLPRRRGTVVERAMPDFSVVEIQFMGTAVIFA
jgi:hypothetical protein